MLHRSVLSSAIVLGALIVAQPSYAQEPTPAPATPSTSDTQPSNSGGGAGPVTAEKKAPAIPAAGYAYADHATASRGTARAHYRQRGAVVNMPGFEQMSDGSSRLFVQLTQSVPVEERKAQGTITYVLKGASPRVWNNTNALVTVHFNTPVSRARLVPQGQDLLFIIELRAAATPTWKMTESTDKSAILTIDFPKGDFTQGAPMATSGEVTNTEGTGAAVPPSSKTIVPARRSRGGHRAAPSRKSTPKP